MKKIIMILPLLVAAFGTAQEQNHLQLSLTGAQQLGLKNRFDVKANRYQIAIAENEIKQTREAFLPEITARGRVNYSPQIQATLIPPGFVGLSQPTIFSLGANSTSIYSLELNMPLYNGILFSETELAKNNRQLQIETKNGKEIEIRKEISLAYFNVLLRKLQYNIAGQEEQRYGIYFRLIEGRYESGTVIENDYLRARLDYENAKQQNYIANQDYLESQRKLRYVLNVPESTTIALTDELGGSSIVDTSLAAVSGIENRSEYKKSLLEIERDELEIKRQRRMALPQVSLIANYSQQHLNTGFNFNYTDSRWWSPFSTIGIQLSIPLTGQLTNRTIVEKSKLALEENQIMQEQLKVDLKYEIESTHAELLNAFSNLENAKRNYQLSQRIYANQEQQIVLGALDYETILNTEASLRAAEGNYITASYNFMVAQLNAMIASGKL